jgi:hypothetical protein
MPPQERKMSRFKAFSIHLGISLTIVVAVLGLLILVWYPWPLFDLEGGWQGVRLVALVDVVLGPALTLLLFKPGKPGLKFDMSLVVAMQVGALAYGMWNLYEARPVALVHALDHIQPQSHARLAEIDESGAAMKKWEAMGPRRIYVRTPDDPVEFADFYRVARSGPAGIHGAVEHYLPMEENWHKILQDAVRIEPYVSRSADLQQRFTAFMAGLGRSVEELAFFPYVGRSERLFLVFDRVSMQIAGVFDAPYDPALAMPEVPRSHRTVASPGVRAVVSGVDLNTED